MSRRKIAVITARADDAEQKEILVGIAEASFSSDTDIIVYSNIYNHWTDDEVLNYENIIYTLFEPCHFDGVIITAEAFRDISVLDGVMEKLRKTSTPVVMIGGECEGVCSIYSDDEKDMENIVEHLVTVHGFTDIDVLTGPEDDPTATSRAKGCRKAFAGHGISFDDSKLHYGNFWNDSGEQLAQRYICGEIPMPQAVICTNDHMAYGLCDALTAAGINIPERITVMGYDHASGSNGGRIYHYPLLTTYRRGRRTMGANAVNHLLGYDYRPDDTDRFVFGNTCSCNAERSQLIAELNTERIGQYHTIMSNVAHFSSRLTMSRTLSEYTEVLTEFIYLLHGVDNACLCLDTAWNSTSYSGDEFICCDITDGPSSPIRYSGTQLPPVCNKNSGNYVYFISPLCFQTRLFGYTVLSYRYPAAYDFSFRDWSKTVADTLEFLRMKNDIHYLKQCQRESSLYDALTGFYNLREFRQILDTATDAHRIFAIKPIFTENGEFVYGENYRSNIISAVATAIKQACADHEVCCRTDDDIFLILCKGNSKILSERLKVMLHNEMCGSYDERQVIICYDQITGRSIDELCASVTGKCSFAMEEHCSKTSMQHYEPLMDIRSAVIAAPHKAPDLTEVSCRLCVSEGYFRSIYKRCFGISYNQECINARMMKACYLLTTTAMSVYAVAVSCGYSDEKYFARQFRQNKGLAPMQYRKFFADICRNKLATY